MYAQASIIQNKDACEKTRMILIHIPIGKIHNEIH